MQEESTVVVANLSLLLRRLSYCMLGHIAIAVFLMAAPGKQIATDDIRHLQHNLLNVQSNQPSSNMNTTFDAS